MRHGVRYELTPEDEASAIITHLAGDDVETDEIEDLIAALKRAGVINGPEMVTLLSRHLNAKFSDKD